MKRTCTKCGKSQSANQFYLNPHTGHWQSWCHKCKAKREADKRIMAGMEKKTFSKIKAGRKLCMCCKRFRAFWFFCKSIRGLRGLAAYCRKCANRKYRNPTKSRAYTAAYRKRHRERYLAKHRLVQHRRRTQQQVVSDGSVTDESLKMLYGQTHCHYCKKYVRPGKRTADHRIPLIKGGPHSMKNLVMACHSCNSAKRDLSDQQFKRRLRRSV